eukprot:20294_1
MGATSSTELHPDKLINCDNVLCKKINSCEYFQRFKCLLRIHNELTTESTFISSVLKHVYSNTTDSYQLMINTLNDYHHIIKNHCDDISFENIIDELSKNIKCNIEKCECIDRRSNYENDINNMDYCIIRVIDSIHQYLIHSYDGGYRFRIDNEYKSNDNIHTSSHNVCLNQRISRNTTFNKFTTNISNNHNTENDIFQFGYRFYYWSKYQNHYWYVDKRYKNYKN